MKTTLVKYLQTEKSSALETDKKKAVYTFIVDMAANKLQIKQAVEQMYEVQVEKVRTMVYASEPVRKYTRTRVMTGKTARYKKALVTLKQGQDIDFYANS